METNEFSLSHLSAIQFEEFCYELLQSLGATRINWRKGTNHKASPADQGRDIECTFPRKEVDGRISTERWFIECKHYKAGVPPQKLDSLLSWANAKRPDVALIIVSGFLSNSAKDFLETFERENRPSYRIKIWEKKDLERLTIGNPRLLRKFQLCDSFPWLPQVHPAHLYFFRDPPLSTLDYFFDILDSLDHEKRRTLFFGAFLCVINPLMGEPTDPERQTLGDLADRPVNYASFRTKCYDLAHIVAPHFIVHAVINEALTSAFRYGDKTAAEEIRVNARRGLTFLREKLQTQPGETRSIRGAISGLEESLE